MDFDEQAREIIRRVDGLTMVNAERLHCVIQAVRYVCRAQVPGCIVECGVWRGGAAAAGALAALGEGDQRDLWLYDTFKGMSMPSEVDVGFDGTSAMDRFLLRQTGPEEADWCRAEQDEVARNLKALGIDTTAARFVAGKVEETLPTTAPDGPIAVLRLDTDWYSSTMAELEHLYPKVAPGGVVIVDDYGDWQGARLAVDEYFAAREEHLLWNRVGGGSIVAVKP